MSDSVQRVRITGATTLQELQQLLDAARARVHLCCCRLNTRNEEDHNGEMLFAIDDFTSCNERFPSRIATWNKDLGAALNEAIDWEIEARSPLGIRLATELDGKSAPPITLEDAAVLDHE